MLLSILKLTVRIFKKFLKCILLLNHNRNVFLFHTSIFIFFTETVIKDLNLVRWNSVDMIPDDEDKDQSTQDTPDFKDGEIRE